MVPEVANANGIEQSASDRAAWRYNAVPSVQEVVTVGRLVVVDAQRAGAGGGDVEVLAHARQLAAVGPLVRRPFAVARLWERISRNQGAVRVTPDGLDIFQLVPDLVELRDRNGVDQRVG